MESKGKKAMDASRPHLLTVAEYMTADIEGRTELIGGVVYDVSPRNEPHRYAVRVLTKLLIQGPRTRVRGAGPRCDRRAGVER